MTGTAAPSGIIEASRLSAAIALAVCVAAGAVIAVEGSGAKAVVGLVFVVGLAIMAVGWLVRRTPLLAYDTDGMVIWGRYFGTRPPVIIAWGQVDDLARLSVRTLRYLTIAYTELQAGTDRSGTGRPSTDAEVTDAEVTDAEVTDAEVMAELVGDDGTRRTRVPYWLCRGDPAGHLAAMRGLWQEATT